MDVAQIYMLALRPTMVPIAGESWAALPFYGQVELEGWSWDLYNAEEKVRADRARSEYSKRSSELEEQRGKGIKDRFDAMRKSVEDGSSQRRIDHLRAEVKRMEADMKRRFNSGEKVDSDLSATGSISAEIANLEAALKKSREDASKVVSQAESAFDKQLAKDKQKSLDALSEQEAVAELQAKNFEFSFRKRVDISTTQLLNCLKAGDKLPTVTLTMHQSSSNTPWILVFTLTGVRLKDYKLRVEASDTMTDMKEEWTAEFEQFGYVYQNRPHAGAKSATAGGATTIGARAVSQSTVRTFAMMPRRLGL